MERHRVSLHRRHRLSQCVAGKSAPAGFARKRAAGRVLDHEEERAGPVEGGRSPSGRDPGARALLPAVLPRPGAAGRAAPRQPACAHAKSRNQARVARSRRASSARSGVLSSSILMNILGISCYFHDAAAALLQNGRLVAAAEEERFSRIKHDFGFPERAIGFCLERGNLAGADLDFVAFFEKPFIKFERILQTALGTVPRSQTVFRKAMTAWMLDKLWVKNRIRDAVGIDPNRILFAEHHESHAASAFFCSPFDHAAILTVDGVGEWATATTGRGHGTSLTLDSEIRSPHSLGLLYSAFTAFLGFEVNEGEYKVMGMAPYGVPRYVDDVRKVVKIHSDGSFELDLDYFTFHYSATRTYSRKFEALFGAPRPPERAFFTASTEYPSYFGPRPGNFDELAAENQHYADIAASIQRVTEDIVLGLARAAHARSGSTRLCMAGGVALNSVANGRILRETPITDLYIQPSA